MNHDADAEANANGIEERLEALRGRLQDACARTSESAASGAGIEAVSAAVDDLNAAAGELVTAGRRMREDQRRYSQLLQLTPCVVTDVEAVIEEANEAAGALLGRDPQSVVGTRLFDFIGPDQRPRVSALHDSARAEPGRVVMADDVTARVDDHTVPLSVRCRAVCDSDDRVAGFGWLLEDLSDRRETENLARRQQDEESARLRTLVRHWQRLESAKSQFLHLASHELRSPVTLLSGYLALLDDGNFGELSPLVERVVALLVAKTGELNDLINDMLETARLDDGNIALRLTDVDVGETIAQMVDDWRPLLRPGQSLGYERPERPVVIEADDARLRNIVGNLLSNAIKYSPDGGPIVCSVVQEGDEAVISVRDGGLGIDADSIGELFTRFGRVVTPATSNLPGTGLGLYISRELARRHGGDIVVESRPGEGSVFIVSLPRSQPALETAAAD